MRIVTVCGAWQLTVCGWSENIKNPGNGNGTSAATRGHITQKAGPRFINGLVEATLAAITGAQYGSR